MGGEVAFNGSGIPVALAHVRQEERRIHVVIMVQNSCICKVQNTVMSVTVPSSWSIFDGAVSGSSWADDIQIAIAIKIAYDGLRQNT